MTKIKMCGLSRPEDIAAVNEVKPDYIGFVFWEKSSRNVSADTAGKLKAELNGDIVAVGVFVDEEPEKVAELLNKGIIDMAQLHGNEDEEYIKKLRELAPDKPVIKAFVVKDEESIARAKECGADYLLLDSGKGTGKTFNWELIKTADFDKPFFLAGGLDPSNVAEAINVLSPYAVDVSSGIESEGHKDPEKMKEFKECCRSVLTT